MKISSVLYVTIFIAFSGHAKTLQIRPDLVPALTQLLEIGPNQWVKLPTNPKGKYIYQRGLSGGLKEALTLLSGNFEPTPRTVSFVADLKLSDLIAHRINSGYSSPLTIRGKTESFDKVDYYTDLEPTNWAIQLRDPLFNNCPDIKNCPVGNRRGETQQLAARNTIDSIEAIGTFIRGPNCQGSSEKPECLEGSVYWVISYVMFYQKLMALGISPDQNSQGFAFFRSLKQMVEDLNLEDPRSIVIGKHHMNDTINIFSNNGAPEYALLKDHPNFEIKDAERLYMFNKRLKDEGLQELLKYKYVQNEIKYFLKKGCVLAYATRNVPKEIVSTREDLTKETEVLLRPDQAERIDNLYDYFATTDLGIENTPVAEYEISQ